MLLALKALLLTYCPADLSLGTLGRECNWEGWVAGSGIVAKQALPAQVSNSPLICF